MWFVLQTIIHSCFLDDVSSAVGVCCHPDPFLPLPWPCHVSRKYLCLAGTIGLVLLRSLPCFHLLWIPSSAVTYLYCSVSRYSPTISSLRDVAVQLASGVWTGTATSTSPSSRVCIIITASTQFALTSALQKILKLFRKIWGNLRLYILIAFLQYT